MKSLRPEDGELSQRAKVLKCLRINWPNRYTATAISDHLGISLDNVSSVLRKMYDKGEVSRVIGGPRGGYKYTVSYGRV